MEKLAEALPQLSDDDLLQVVQMVHDNKTDDTYTKNDVESKFSTVPSSHLRKHQRSVTLGHLCTILFPISKHKI
jgi:transcription initiation factor IIF auxiliary subunit